MGESKRAALYPSLATLHPNGRGGHAFVPNDVHPPSMTLKELTQLASRGEGLTLEFKKRVPTPERLAKEVIALANTAGGHVLIGVEDNGSVAGLRDAIEEEFTLREALNEHCDPPVDFETERVPISNKRDVLVVTVPRSDERPHYLVGNGADRAMAYVRVESMSVEASREAVRLMRQRADDPGVRFTFGEREKLLLRYLDAYGRITVTQFASLSGIPPRQASHTLVLLTKARLLDHHVDPNEDYFSLARKNPAPGTGR